MRAKQLGEYPIIRAIIIKNPDRNAEPITDFRKLYEPIAKIRNAQSILIRKGDIEEANKLNAKLPENWVSLEQAYRALQVKENLIKNIIENPDETKEAKLHLTNIILKQMINEAKHAINIFYGKKVYTIKLDND
jgi:hypothetical protein